MERNPFGSCLMAHVLLTGKTPDTFVPGVPNIYSLTSNLKLHASKYIAISIGCGRFRTP